MDITEQEQIKKKMYKPLAQLIVNQQVDQLIVENRLMEPRENYVKRNVEALQNDLYVYGQKLEERFKRAGALLQQELETLAPESKALYEKELATAMEMIAKVGPNFNVLDDKKVLAANTFQDFLGLSKELMSWIYSIGHRLFGEKKGEDAYAIFHLLVTLNSLVCEYWIGLGFAQHLVQQTQESLHSFSMASILNPEQPTARYQSARIYLELKQFDDAQVELEVLQEIIDKYHLDKLQTSCSALKDEVQRLRVLEGG